MKLLFEVWRKFINENQVPNTRVFVIIKPSDIHGKGVFAGEYIPKGTEIGITAIRNGEKNWQIPILGKFHNHSEKPTCCSVASAPIEEKKYTRMLVADRDIFPDEELTVDYRLQPDLEQPGSWAK